MPLPIPMTRRKSDSSGLAKILRQAWILGWVACPMDSWLRTWRGGCQRGRCKPQHAKGRHASPIRRQKWRRQVKAKVVMGQIRPRRLSRPPKSDLGGASVLLGHMLGQERGRLMLQQHKHGQDQIVRLIYCLALLTMHPDPMIQVARSCSKVPHYWSQWPPFLPS